MQDICDSVRESSFDLVGDVLETNARGDGRTRTDNEPSETDGGKHRRSDTASTYGESLVLF